MYNGSVKAPGHLKVHLVSSVSSRFLSLSQFYKNFTEVEEFVHQNDSFWTEIWLNWQEKASFFIHFYKNC